MKTHWSEAAFNDFTQKKAVALVAAEALLKQRKIWDALEFMSAYDRVHAEMAACMSRRLPVERVRQLIMTDEPASGDPRNITYYTGKPSVTPNP